ncbi:MAG: hypothetical protein AMXMBFR34_26550 [Myxococcaceae bacterium]
MPPSPTTAAPLTFESFWRWLQEHRNCVVRVGNPDVMLTDAEPLHWDFFDEPDGQAVCQLILGKALVGEVVIERGDVLFVQASPDPEQAQAGHWMFECFGGTREDSYPLFLFVTTHGMEAAQGHLGLKH